MPRSKNHLLSRTGKRKILRSLGQNLYALGMQVRHIFQPWSINQSHLTHWGRVTHTCVGKLAIIGSDNGLSPGRRQAIIWINAGILLIGRLGVNFSEILIAIETFSFKNMHLKISSAKWRPFCFGLNVLNGLHGVSTRLELNYTQINLFTQSVLDINSLNDALTYEKTMSLLVQIIACAFLGPLDPLFETI